MRSNLSLIPLYDFYKAQMIVNENKDLDVWFVQKQMHYQQHCI